MWWWMSSLILAQGPSVMSDLEMVPAVASAVLRRMPNGELIFTVERALNLIGACSWSGIAVLGVEVFPGLNVSTYDQHLKSPTNESHWSGYVRTSNALAEDFLRKNPAPSTAECILTTTSWREFCETERNTL
jgi:hypothetical protein